jgi:hypothetical protein
MTGQERRRHRRYEVEGLSGRLANRHPFEVLKLSLGGMLVKVRQDQEPQLGALTEVELTLDGASLRCQGRVVFVGPDLDEGSGHDLFRVGLAFVTPPAEARRRLQQFIASELGPP